MKTYVAYKKDQVMGDLYLKKDNSFTWDISDPEIKEYKGRFWIELLNVLIKLIITFGIDIKLKQK